MYIVLLIVLLIVKYYMYSKQRSLYYAVESKFNCKDMVVCMTHISFKGTGISYSRTIVYVCFQYYRN